jgi:hypothetical protein
VHIAILSPVYRDQAAVRHLWSELDAALREAAITAHWWLVDDGSRQHWPATGWPESTGGLQQVSVLPLRRNLGHQRAIALGLAWIAAKTEVHAFTLVMDADGEDRPLDAVKLLRAAAEQPSPAPLVFAERTRRSEGLLFRLGYFFYLTLHRVMVGTAPKVGNFSVIPKEWLGWLVTDSDLWNHYAACVWKSRLPKKLIATTRGIRVHGHSQMNWSNLVTHGISAIACYRELMTVRLLGIAFGIFLLIILSAMVSLVLVACGKTLPTWLVPSLFFGSLMLVPIMIFGLVWCVHVLQQRQLAGFLPIRDYQYYIDTPIQLL